jgi:predicted DNA-binding transcriptional regulator AlpA
MTTLVSSTPDTATGTKLAAEIADKRAYAARWGFSVRHIDNLLAQGCPHLKIGKRRVRLVVAEADEWMKRTFATQRRRPARTPATVGVKQG